VRVPANHSIALHLNLKSVGFQQAADLSFESRKKDWEQALTRFAKKPVTGMVSDPLQSLNSSTT
jgi:hypothetical protein